MVYVYTEGLWINLMWYSANKTFIARTRFCPNDVVNVSFTPIMETGKDEKLQFSRQ